MRQKTLFELEYGRNYWKTCKIKMHTVESGVWREN